MRAFLDAILAFIGAASLSDEEYDSIDQTDLAVSTYNQAVYNALAAVLVDRAAASTTKDRLTWFFKSKGLAIDEAQVSSAKSQIYLGDVLC